MEKYIHEKDNWPTFTWDVVAVSKKLIALGRLHGRLIGRMETLGFKLREEAVLQTLTEDVLKSSEIEGEVLDKDQVRSSIARRLGMDIGGLISADRNVDGVVEVMLDATQNFDQKLTKERLFDWHAALFPTGRSGMRRIIVGDWRDDAKGPMQVVSGSGRRERVHFEAPEAKRLSKEMSTFLNWFNRKDDTDPLLRAALAHFWFVTVHPFEDGNGRIARAIADMVLARSEDSSQRFYSMSAQIRIERKVYYEVLEKTQKGTLDITAWMVWFFECLGRSIQNTDKVLADVLYKATFWEDHKTTALNERQRKVLNRLLDGFEGKLTSTKWAKLTKCSQDTASRDINDLIDKGVLTKDPAGGRSTSYSLAEG